MYNTRSNILSMLEAHFNQIEASSSENRGSLEHVYNGFKALAVEVNRHSYQKCSIFAGYRNFIVTFECFCFEE